MSDIDALMKEKNDLIKKMLEMQQKFLEMERAEGVSPKEYYTPSAGTFMEEYKKDYHTMAMRVNKIAHEIKGSGHIH